MSRGIWQELAALTPARIGLGRTGSAQTTAETLRFALAHATARDAVHTPFDADTVASGIGPLGLATLVAESAADSRQTYFLRPDLGRRLSAESRDRILALAADPVDLALGRRRRPVIERGARPRLRDGGGAPPACPARGMVARARRGGATGARGAG